MEYFKTFTNVAFAVCFGQLRMDIIVEDIKMAGHLSKGFGRIRFYFFWLLKCVIKNCHTLLEGSF